MLLPDISSGMLTSQVSGEFHRWFAGSKVTDENGNPLIVYRGEHGIPAVALDTHVAHRCDSGFSYQSRVASLSFGSECTARLYATQPNQVEDFPHFPRMIPAYLCIRNPVMSRANDPYIEFSEITELLGGAKARRIALELADSITNTCNWMDNFSEKYDSVSELLDSEPGGLSQLYVDAYTVFDCKNYVGWFQNAGFDGAIHGGSGQTFKDTEFKVFCANQVMPLASWQEVKKY